MKWMMFIIGVLEAGLSMASPVKSSLATSGAEYAQTTPATSYTAADYIQDGLIAMWDGIENAGFGVHDPNAVTWKDLSGNGLDLTVDLNCGEWESNCIRPFGRQYENQYGCPAYRENARADLNALGVAPTTIEIVCPIYYHGGYSVPVSMTYVQGRYWQLGIIYDSFGMGANQKDFNGSYGLGSASCSITQVLWNGVEKTQISHTYGGGGEGYNNLDIGIGGINDRKTSSRRRPYSGRIYIIRVYSRDLSLEERLYNYQIDKERFSL